MHAQHVRSAPTRWGAGVLAAAALAVAGLAVTPAGAQTPTPTEPTVPTTVPAPVTKKVAVKDNYFKPKKVKLAVGDKIKFTWKGFAIHDVKVEKGPQKFESKQQSSGTFTRTIKKPGKYRIICTIHPGMEMSLKAT